MFFVTGHYLAAVWVPIGNKCPMALFKPFTTAFKFEKYLFHYVCLRTNYPHSNNSRLLGNNNSSSNNKLTRLQDHQF